jgi:hypothetical protein
LDEIDEVLSVTGFLQRLGQRKHVLGADPSFDVRDLFGTGDLDAEG